MKINGIWSKFMFDEFLYKWRFYLGGFLVLVILAGIGAYLWDKTSRAKSNVENQQITELRTQNDLLRSQLAQESSKEIAGAQTADVQEQGDKININTASVQELDKLPGIGAVRAADIIAYRTEHPFKTIEELKEIKGIGDKSFEDLKDLITVGE